MTGLVALARIRRCYSGELNRSFFAFITPMRKHQLKNVKKLDRAHEEVVLALRRGDPEDLTVTFREHLESYGKFLEPGNLDLHPSDLKRFRCKTFVERSPLDKVSL